MRYVPLILALPFLAIAQDFSSDPSFTACASSCLPASALQQCAADYACYCTLESEPEALTSCMQGKCPDILQKYSQEMASVCAPGQSTPLPPTTMLKSSQSNPSSTPMESPQGNPSSQVPVPTETSFNPTSTLNKPGTTYLSTPTNSSPPPIPNNSSPSSTPNSSSPNKYVIIGATLGCVILLLTIALVLVWRKLHKSSGTLPDSFQTFPENQIHELPVQYMTQRVELPLSRSNSRHELPVYTKTGGAP